MRKRIVDLHQSVTISRCLKVCAHRVKQLHALACTSHHSTCHHTAQERDRFCVSEINIFCGEMCISPKSKAT